MNCFPEPTATYDKTTGKWITTPYGHAQNARVNARIVSDPVAQKILLDRLAVILKEQE